MSEILAYVLLLFLAATAIGIVRLRGLIAVVMLSGIYSLLAASLFIVLDAPDVALTEAAVGAGAATMLMLGTVALTTREEKPARFRPVSFLVVVVTGLMLIYGTFSLPLFGAEDAPAQVHVGPRYLTEGYEQTGVPNIVTAVLASYRGFDTLGEVVVILSAGVGVITLLAGRRRDQGEREGERGG
jgi:multicomponent Na+:H+ antiporter subunit B